MSSMVALYRLGELLDSEPEFWAIVDDRLYSGAIESDRARRTEGREDLEEFVNNRN